MQQTGRKGRKRDEWHRIKTERDRRKSALCAAAPLIAGTEVFQSLKLAERFNGMFRGL